MNDTHLMVGSTEDENERHINIDWVHQITCYQINSPDGWMTGDDNERHLNIDWVH